MLPESRQTLLGPNSHPTRTPPRPVHFIRLCPVNIERQGSLPECDVVAAPSATPPTRSPLKYDKVPGCFLVAFPLSISLSPIPKRTGVF